MKLLLCVTFVSRQVYYIEAAPLGIRLMEWAIDYVITEVVPVIGVRFITVDCMILMSSQLMMHLFFMKSWGLSSPILLNLYHLSIHIVQCISI